MNAHIRLLVSWAAALSEKSMSAPFGEQGEALGGDPVDLAADIAELLPGHGPGLHARGDALRDDRGT